MARLRFRFPLAGLLGLLSLPTLAEIPDEFLSSPLAEQFGTSATIDRPRLSPDGKKMLYLQQDPQGIYVLQVIDFASGEIVSLLRGSEEEYDIGWCEWANETRVLCDFIYAVNDDGSELRQIPPGRIREPTERYASYCSVNAETRAGQLLVDWLPEMPEFVQRTCNSSLRLNIYTGQSIAQRAAFNIPGQPMSDGHAFARLQRWRNIDSAFDRWYFRTSEEQDWIVLNEINPIRFEDPFRPIGFGETVNELYHLAADNGKWGLYGIDLGSAERENVPIFAHPVFDIAQVDQMGLFDRVVAAAYLDGRPQRYVVDGPVAAAYEAALALFPDDNLEIVDENWDGNLYLLLVRKPGRSGDYYLLNVDEGAIAPIGPEYQHLVDVELAETRTVTFPGADGGTIAGHLTMPIGREPIGAVVMPRGLPGRLDVADPHYLVQYLAASGYAVLRTEFRGSPEYGAWLVERVALGWEQAAADVGSAADYLVAEGIAEPNRICAIGRDVGAYAALMNSIVEPGRLACIVGIGAVSDARALAGPIVNSVIGDQDDIMRRGSPTRRAEEVSAPVLLFHGNFDGIVSMFNHTSPLTRALERRDREVQFIEYRYGRHEIDRGVYRIDMLTRIGAFLDEKIGTP